MLFLKGAGHLTVICSTVPEVKIVFFVIFPSHLFLGASRLTTFGFKSAFGAHAGGHADGYMDQETALGAF